MRPFFVIGPQKTGTTLLARLLDQQPRVACLFESKIWSAKRSVLVEGGSNGELHGFAAHDQARWRELFAPAFWDDCDPGQERRTEVLRDVLTSVLLDFGRRTGADVVGDKWPFYSDRLPLLHDAFPNAVFIHTVRDPRAHWHSGEHFRDRRRGWKILEDQLRRDEQIRDFFACRETPLEVLRYEDLVADPGAVVTGILERLGVDTSNVVLDYDPSVDPYPARWDWVAESTGAVDRDHADKWRDRVDNATVARVEARSALFMRRYGYSPTASAADTVGVETLPDDEVAATSLVLREATETSALAAAEVTEQRRRADEQVDLVTAGSAEIERLGRIVAELEARLRAQQRRLDRRVVRTGLKVADSLGRALRRTRGSAD